MCFVKMLFLVGFGLGDVKDIIVKGLEVVKKCKRVYLEVYMLILIVGKDVLVWILIYDVIMLYMIMLCIIFNCGLYSYRGIYVFIILIYFKKYIIINYDIMY